MVPDFLLRRFRKNIREASKSSSKEKIPRKKKNRTYIDSEDLVLEENTLKGRASKIVNRLYQPLQIFSNDRDFYGNRCPMNEQQLSEHVKLPLCVSQ